METSEEAFDTICEGLAGKADGMKLISIMVV